MGSEGPCRITSERNLSRNLKVLYLVPLLEFQTRLLLPENTVCTGTYDTGSSAP